MSDGKGYVETWKKRYTGAIKRYEEWEKEFRVQECYNYWVGNQLAEPTDEFGARRAQINKIHPEVRNNIPSLYYYRPFVRLTAAPEHTDDPGSQIEADTQLLQDTVNHIIRDKDTMFRENTFLGLKEAHWAFGLVEVGYSAEFVDAPTAPKPALKEKKDTKIAPEAKEKQDPVNFLEQAAEMQMAATAGLPDDPLADPMLDPQMGMAPEPDPLQEELEQLQSEMKSERFFVKFIPACRTLIAETDHPILQSNDWVGYWEDVPLADVKASRAYKNTSDLKAAIGDKEATENAEKANEAEGITDKIRLYKIWDLRTMDRWVFAEGHKKELLRKKFKRCPLKFLRFDIDPYHFFPRPILLSKLGPQDEYNDSREYLRKIRKGTVPRYTYDEDAIDAVQLQKLESGEMGTYVPRKPGTSNVIEPVNQPSFSENAIQTLTLSDKEFADVGGVGGDAKVAATKTATQAKIAETKEQAQDNFDRLAVADWLSEIARELLCLAIDNMSMDRWIAMNIAPDAMYATPQLSEGIQQSYQRINSSTLQDAAHGLAYEVTIDVESLSPVSEEEKFQKWMQGLTLLGNPSFARLFSVAPPLLIETLKYMGLRSAKDQGLLVGAMQTVVQMEAQLAAQGQASSTGVSPTAGGGQPGAPTQGGPQPGGPVGPGASKPNGGQ